MIVLKEAYYYEHLNHDYVINHTHDCFELVFYIKGKAVTSTENASYSMSAPCIAIIPPNLSHDEKEVTETYVYVAQYDSDEKVSNDIDIHTLNQEQADRLIDIFKQIVALNKDNLDKKEKEQKQLLFSVVLSLLQTFRFMSKSDTDQNNAVIFVKNFIKKNYSLNIDYEALAVSYGYSYSRLRHIFKKYTDTSLHQYCNYIRLTNAKKLLKETNYSVNKIAALCGYNSNVVFNIAFRKEMNISPLKFRDIVRKNNAGDVIQMGGQ